MARENLHMIYRIVIQSRRVAKRMFGLIAKPLQLIKRRIVLIERGLTGNQLCQACGYRGRFHNVEALWPELIAEWELSPEWVNWFNIREGQSCPKCYSNLRAGKHSEAILKALNGMFGLTATSLDEAFDQRHVRELRIAEINSAGALHQFLVKCQNLHYSEFGSIMPEIPSEDLMNLSYDSDFFDLVITSETLEHVPDVDIALREIHRVIKPNGMHVFTVPIICDRTKTRQRARIQKGDLKHIFPPSYHGGSNEKKDDFLVFYEFGKDFMDRCRKAGFDMITVSDNGNPALVAFIARKTDPAGW